MEVTEDEKEYTLQGYRWRDELVTKLLPLLKEGVDPRHLNNVVSKYVPTYFPSMLPNGTEANWIFPFSVRPENTWWVEEIENIGKDFYHEMSMRRKQKSYRARKEHDIFIDIFKKYNWEVENTHVKGISCLDKTGRWKYDAIKNRIAVEVELSDRYHIFKDAFKFLIGQSMNQINVGILIVPKYLEKNKQPYLGWIDPNSHPIFTTLPMLKVVFYGFPNRSRKY